MAQKINHLEMIDVLLGHADPVQEKRVQDAVARDGRLALEYERWERVLPALKTHTVEIEGSAARVQSAVMEEISQGLTDRSVDADWFPQNPEQKFFRDLLLLGQGFPRMRPIVLAAASVAVLAIVVLTVISIRGGAREFGFVETVQGNVEWFDPTGERHEAEEGKRIPVHARIATGSESRIALRLQDETLMTFAEETEATWAEPAMVKQQIGKATYRTKHVAAPGTSENKVLFSVVTPHGLIEDLGTEFSVEVRKENVSVVEVESGTVQIRPRDGASGQAVAGERALMNARRLVVEKPLSAMEKVPAKVEEKTMETVDITFVPKRVPLGADDDYYDFILPEAKSDGREAYVLEGEVKIPGQESEAVKHFYSLIDTDLDQDFSDAGGALGAWSVEINGGKPRMQSIAPPASPSVYAGYKWKLESEGAEAFRLTGAKSDRSQRTPLRPGDLMPTIEVSTIDGQKMQLGAPGDGFLLIYTWTTWFSACQRDVPFAFEGLYPRFKDRGLKMVGVAVEPHLDSVINYLQSNSMQFPQVYNGPDITEGVTGQLGIHQAPLAVLVDAQGRVVSVGKSSSEIWSFLDAHLPKNP